MTPGVAVAFLSRCLLLALCIYTGLAGPGAVSVVGWVLTGFWAYSLIGYVWKYLNARRL